MKVGYQGSFQKSAQGRVSNQSQLEYRFNNGVPNAVSYYLAPRWEQNDRTETHSIFAQDQWTRGRLTLQGALRYDRAWSWAPADGNGTSLTSQFNPAADQLPGNGEREGLQRHHAARRGRLRRVRQRQDRREGERRQVPAGRHQRRELLGQQPGPADGDERAQPGLDGRQPQLRGGLQPPESGGAEQPGDRRRQLRGGHGNRSELRQHQPEPDDGQSRHPAGLGHPSVRLAVRRDGAAAADAARLARGRATTGAGSATSS